MGLNLFMVQPLFSGEVFAQYKLILLPFLIRNLQAFLQKIIVPNPIPPGTSPPSEGLGEALLLSLFYFGGSWGGRSFIFQIFPSTPPLALKYWKYEHVIFRQNTPFLSFTAAADAFVDQFITFYFLSSLSPNTFLLSFFRCLFFTNFPRSLCSSVIV